MIQVTDFIRVDCGKVRKRAVATEELLSDDVTATHYKLILGQDKDGNNVPGRGADGEIIELGKEMEYLDHKSKELEWVVYQLEAEVAEGFEEKRYLPVSRHPSETEAMVAAAKLAEAS